VARVRFSERDIFSLEPNTNSRLIATMHPNTNPISNFFRILESKVNKWIVGIVDDQGGGEQKKQQVDPK